jgi:hypothetical protein
MADRNWDVLEFVERFRNGEFDGHLAETLDSLSPEQRGELQGQMIRGESGIEISPQDDLTPDKST